MSSADDDIRDTWLQVIRRASILLGASCCAGEEDVERPEAVISVYPDEGTGRTYLVFAEDHDRMVEALSFVGLVGVAYNARGITVVGKTMVNLVCQSEDESDDAFRERCASGQEDNAFDAFSAVTIYRDTAGDRRVVSLSRPILPSGDGVEFGKAEISEPDAALFGGMVELMPERPPSPFIQVAAANWLVANAETEMVRLAIHTSDIGV